MFSRKRVQGKVGGLRFPKYGHREKLLISLILLFPCFPVDSARFERVYSEKCVYLSTMTSLRKGMPIFGRVVVVVLGAQTLKHEW